MKKQFDDWLDQLRRLNLSIRHDLELAEARVEMANALVAQLAATGLTSNRVFLGEIILQRAYDVQWDSGSGQVVQASLSARSGFGAIYWDSEEAALMWSSPQLDIEALGHHRPFEQCEPAVRALLLHQLEPLLGKFIRSLGLR